MARTIERFTAEQDKSGGGYCHDGDFIGWRRRLLGINRTTLLSRMKTLGIDPKQYA
ncbi:MAG TPA: hypothetical protein VHV54_15160 [Candidatus Binatia bacterium]|nr:hypothetical protein [Candidatus Binatia bacterium]